jgi:hypothetical protein
MRHVDRHVPEELEEGKPWPYSQLSGRSVFEMG